MPNIGPMEILVVLLVALVVLGPSRLPEAGRQVGRALAEVRRWSSNVRSEVDGALHPGEPVSPVAGEPRARPDGGARAGASAP